MISTAQWLRGAGIAIVVLAWFALVAGVLITITVIYNGVHDHTDTDVVVTASLITVFGTALATALLLAAGYGAQTFARSAVLRQLAVPGDRADALTYSVRN
jgi:hypothetical protein